MADNNIKIEVIGLDRIHKAPAVEDCRTGRSGSGGRMRKKPSSEPSELGKAKFRHLPGSVNIIRELKEIEKRIYQGKATDPPGCWLFALFLIIVWVLVALEYVLR